MRKWMISFFISLCFLAPGHALFAADEKEPISILAVTSKMPSQVISAFESYLKKKGYSACTKKSWFCSSCSPFGIYTHGDKQRYVQFKGLLESPEKILWAARGGYGAQSVLRQFVHDPLFKKEAVSKKVLIGYSDLTLLGLYFMHHYDWIFLHGPMLMYNKEVFPAHKKKINHLTSLESVFSLIEGKKAQVNYELIPLNEAAKSAHEVEAPVLGGNLSVIQRNIGGFLKDIDWSDKILFLEDLNEGGPRLRDTLEGLLDTGKFNTIKAVILGDFKMKSVHPEKDRKTFFNLIITYFKKYISPDIPIYHQSAFGHGAKNNPLPMNMPSKISLNEKGVPMLSIDVRSLATFLAKKPA